MMTLKEVGVVLGISRERVRQLEKGALEKLRKNNQLKNYHYGDFSMQKKIWTIHSFELKHLYPFTFEHFKRKASTIEAANHLYEEYIHMNAYLECVKLGLFEDMDRPRKSKQFYTHFRKARRRYLDTYIAPEKTWQCVYMARLNLEKLGFVF